MIPTPGYTPPAFGRVLLLLVGLAWRRFRNVTSVGFAALNRKKPSDTGRKATPRKRRGGRALMLFMPVIMLFSMMNMSTQALRAAGRAVRAPAIASVEDASEIPHLAREIAHGYGEAKQPASLKPWPDRSFWPAPAGETAWLRLQAVILLAIFLSILISQFGLANPDLARVESSLEWLYTFPAPARTLFAAKIAEYAALNGWLWLWAAPYAFCLFLAAGRGWWALPLALGFVVLQAVFIAATRLVAECALRRYVSPGSIKNAQAACTILGLGLFMACFAGMSSPWLLGRAATVGALAGGALLWLPSGWPAAAGRADLLAPALAGGAGVTGLFLAAGLWTAQRLTRDGLVTAGSAYVGARKPARRGRRPGALGIAGKDFLLLCRDRNFFVQTLVLPLLMVGGYAVGFNAEGTLGALASPTHGPVIAFGLGASVLMFSALQVLGAEGAGLWLLYTVPRRIEALLLRKTVFWGGVAMIYTGAVLLFCASRQEAISADFVVSALLAVAGVFLYAFIGAGIGTLGTDPLATEAHRRIRTDRVFIYLFLASFFAYAIYTPSLWQKLAQLILSIGLAAALWQKVRDQLPYLLDPVSAPPPRISLSDGMIAAVAFFVLQVVLTLILMLAEVALPPEAILLIAFAGAGALVAATTLLAHWRQGVPELLAQVGFRRGADRVGAGPVAGLGIGLAAGALALGGAWLYLALVPHVPGLMTLALEQKAGQPAAGNELGFLWIAILAILAAPLCEEYIFRGLVFRGLRRSFAPILAMAASAALFAVVHPPFSAIPVFGLGLACAFAFERSKTLLAPLATHALYNAVVFLVLSPAFLASLPEPPPPAPPLVLNDAALPAEAGKDELVLPGRTLREGETFPMLVVLHATGGSPREALDPVRSLVKHWKYAVYAPCGSVPATATGTWNREPGYDWNAARDLDRVADQVREWLAKLPVHPGGIYLVGHGSGANLAMLLGIRHPDLFAGVIAVGGRIQPELLDAAQIARAAPPLPVYSVHDMQDRSHTPAIRAEMLGFFETHSFATRTVEYPRLPGMAELLLAGINSINADRTELLKSLSEETPAQAAAWMRREVPGGMAVETAGRFVLASDAPEPVRQGLVREFAAVQRRCAALIGRGDLGDGPAIRVYYPQTQGEQASLYRSIMGADIPWMHGLVTWSPHPHLGLGRRRQRLARPRTGACLRADRLATDSRLVERIPRRGARLPQGRTASR